MYKTSIFLNIKVNKIKTENKQKTETKNYNKKIKTKIAISNNLIYESRYKNPK